MPISSRTQLGLTFVELIISMLIISVAVIGVFSAYSTSIAHSADPMIQQQAVSIAEAYMDEILAKAYDELDASGAAEGALGAEADETSRAQFDDVNDYLALPDNLVRDQDGNAIANLANYQVSVSIVQANDELGLAAADFAIAQRINISVSNPVLPAPYQLSAYKADFTNP